MNNFGSMNRGLNIFAVPTISGPANKVAIPLRKPQTLRPVSFLKIREAHERSAFFIQQ
jgi:hypothetical protein